MQRQFSSPEVSGRRRTSASSRSARQCGEPRRSRLPVSLTLPASRANQRIETAIARSPGSQTTKSPAWELALALCINCLWIGAAASGAIKLLPVRVEQNQRLEQAETKVVALQKRVAQLQKEVERGLDASQAEAEIVARLHHISPERMQVQILPDMPVAAPPSARPTPSPSLLAPELDASRMARVLSTSGSEADPNDRGDRSLETPPPSLP